MSTCRHRNVANRKRRIQRRLRPRTWVAQARPMYTASNIQYDLSERLRALDAGGIGGLHLLAQRKGLVDIAYNGTWGYHPLVVSLANTGEPLSLVNRSGNRPSAEGAAARNDQAIAVCRRAGFRGVTLRGDTDFSQTAHLDRWHHDGVRFVFGYDARQSRRAGGEAAGGGLGAADAAAGGGRCARCRATGRRT